jgi:hypothetical protein
LRVWRQDAALFVTSFAAMVVAGLTMPWARIVESLEDADFAWRMLAALGALALFPALSSFGLASRCQRRRSRGAASAWRGLGR